MPKAVQLRLTRPVRRVRVRRLTARQRALVELLRFTGGMQAERVGRMMGYAYPRAACERLVRRGLVVRRKGGVYEARKLSERRA